MTSRRARGGYFTPSAVASHLATAALAGTPRPATVCDPAAGDGRMLAAVVDAVRGARPRLFGADLHESEPAGLEANWRTVDSLTRGTSTWEGSPADGFDLVIGNPPFRNQLELATSLGPAERAEARRRFGSVARGYADTAAMFLVAACEMAAPTGRIALIMPLSFLAARDAAPARRRVLELATLDGLWIAPDQVFPDADVRVCALVLDRSGPRTRSVRRWVGAEFEPIEPCLVDSDALFDAPTWSHLAAAAFDVPEVDLDCTRRLGDLVSATAGFRDQFYGLAPLVRECAEEPGGSAAPLITCGLIDPGSAQWGERTTRIAGATWRRPVVDLADLDLTSPLGRWVVARRRPKLVVATQTKVVEAAVDSLGRWIPSTPVIAAHGEPDDLWPALAVLLAPPTSAWARARYGGAAMSADAIKLSARQVEELPLPVDSILWSEAADLLHAAHDRGGGGIDIESVVDAGAVMTRAYGCGDAVTGWWEARLPRRR